MKDFAAIDFETANGSRSSVCSVGIVIVKDGEIVDKFYNYQEKYEQSYSKISSLSSLSIFSFSGTILFFHL